MSSDRDTTRIVRSWLDEGVTALPDRVLDAVLDQVSATPQRRLWWPARRFPVMNNTIVRLGIAAAALVLAVVLGSRLLPGGGVGGGPDATPTPSASPIPTPSPASFDDHAGGGAALAPGSYFTDKVSPVRLTFTVPTGWSKAAVPGVVWTEDSAAWVGFFSVDNVYGDGCGVPTLLEPPVGPTVDDLATAIARMSGPGLEAAAPTDVTLAEYAGKRVELIAPANWDSCEGAQFRLWDLPAGLDFVPLDPGARMRIWILDVDGTRLVIGANARPEATTAQLAQLDGIVDSIQTERP